MKLQKKATKQAAKAATKAKTASLSVFHPGQKDPLAYEALEDHVNMLKQQEAQNTAKIQQELAKKMSARKGGDQQVQELLTVLPASFGPVGRRKTYIRPVTEAQGFNNMIN